MLFAVSRLPSFGFRAEIRHCKVVLSDAAAFHRQHCAFGTVRHIRATSVRRPFAFAKGFADFSSCRIEKNNAYRKAESDLFTRFRRSQQIHRVMDFRRLGEQLLNVSETPRLPVARAIYPAYELASLSAARMPFGNVHDGKFVSRQERRGNMPLPRMSRAELVHSAFCSSARESNLGQYQPVVFCAAHSTSTATLPLPFKTAVP